MCGVQGPYRELLKRFRDEFQDLRDTPSEVLYIEFSTLEEEIGRLWTEQCMPFFSRRLEHLYGDLPKELPELREIEGTSVYWKLFGEEASIRRHGNLIKSTGFKLAEFRDEIASKFEQLADFLPVSKYHVKNSGSSWLRLVCGYSDWFVSPFCSRNVITENGGPDEFESEDGTIIYDATSVTHLTNCAEASILLIDYMLYGDNDHDEVADPAANAQPSLSKDSEEKKFSVSDLCGIAGISRDTLRKYGKPAVDKWPGQGGRAFRFAEEDAVSIVSAVKNGMSARDVQEKCQQWLEELNTN